LLAISLGALVVGSALLFIDFNQYPARKPDPVPPPSSVKPLAGQPSQAPATSPQPTP
jgi:hypothetical protein